MFELISETEYRETMENTVEPQLAAIREELSMPLEDGGVLHATELVTKCPSKYENASSALSVSRLLEYGDQVVDKPVKVSGTVQAGSLKAASAGDRFVLADPDSGKTLPVAFDGALSDEIAEGSSLVVTGSLSADGRFTATDVALEG